MALSMLACAGEDDTSLDGARDAESDPRDAGVFDARPPDARSDASRADATPHDAGPGDGSTSDAERDASFDGSFDASFDGAPSDASDGATTDARVDAPVDAPIDVGTDSGLASCAMGTAPPALTVEDVTPGVTFDAPVHALAAPGDPDTLYVVEKGGTIAIARDGLRIATFLDLRAGLEVEAEGGLLGMAFHPGFATNGRFFVYFTPGAPSRNVVAEFRRSATNPLAAGPEVRRLVELDDPEPNHNGGMITFGPDGYLYVAIGDGGGSGDRHGTLGNGLDPTTLFGSLLRLDVDAPARDYAAAGNPFTLPTGLPQVFHYGLRNPWRFSFDAETGDLWIGDVGQDLWEEITVLPTGTASGRNLGWAAYEGVTVYRPELVPQVPVHTPPQIVYRHYDDRAPVGGLAVVGGVVYRGGAIAALRGWYLYGDTFAPHVGAIAFCVGAVRHHVRVPGLTAQGDALVSFGEDGRNELLLVYLGSGKILRVVAE